MYPIQDTKQKDLGLHFEDGYSGKIFIIGTDKQVEDKVIKLLFIKTRLLAASGPGKSSHVLE